MNELFFVFVVSLNSRDDNVILFQQYHCGFFTNFVFIWIVQFFDITFHTSSNCNWKKQWILHFFKYQFYLIKNKFNMFDKNNHHNVSTFQQIKFLITKKHYDSMMIQCVHTYYWFLQHVFFCIFQIDDLTEAEYVFLYFICMFFRDEMFMSMII